MSAGARSVPKSQSATQRGPRSADAGFSGNPSKVVRDAQKETRVAFGEIVQILRLILGRLYADAVAQRSGQRAGPGQTITETGSVAFKASDLGAWMNGYLQFTVELSVADRQSESTFVAKCFAVADSGERSCFRVFDIGDDEGSDAGAGDGGSSNDSGLSKITGALGIASE